MSHSITYFFEDFNEVPVLDIRFLVSLKDQDFLALRAHSNTAAVCIPGEALDTWHDSISGQILLSCSHFARVYLS